MHHPNGAVVRRRRTSVLAAGACACAAAVLVGTSGVPDTRWPPGVERGGTALASLWEPRVEGADATVEDTLLDESRAGRPSGIPPRAASAEAAGLPRAQAAVASWIAKRYRVAAAPVGRLVEEAWALGRREALEPTLILAIVAIESSFDPRAQSPVGAQGLMQVMTRVHLDKFAPFGGAGAAFDPVSNLRVGVRVLVECIERAGSVEQGLRHYVGAANLPSDGGYAAKVLAEQAQLQRVAAGRAVPTAVAADGRGG